MYTAGMTGMLIFTSDVAVNPLDRMSQSTNFCLLVYYKFS